MGAKFEFHRAQFQSAFFHAVEEELEKAASVFRRNLSTVLRSTGKSPPASPRGSKIPYNRTGTLARSWHVQPSRRNGSKVVAGVETGVRYAFDLVKRSGGGRRNYMDGRLAWRRKTNEMILKRLETKRLVANAIRRFKS